MSETVIVVQDAPELITVTETEQVLVTNSPGSATVTSTESETITVTETETVIVVEGGSSTAIFQGAGAAGLVPDPTAESGRFLKDDGSWDIPAGSGSGDVNGPSSSVDNAVCIFDGITGKLIQNSLVTIDGSGNIATPGTVDGRDVATDGSKLDGVAAGANNYSHPNHSGDVTSVADGAQTIVASAVTNAKIADMAQALLKGRASGAGTGAPQDLTATQVRTIINVEDGATADQTGAEIKSLYEAEADTNAYTDAEKSKLAGIEAGADADQVASEVPFTPAGDLGSTDVQAALEELDSEKSATGHSHSTFSQDADGFAPGPTAAEIAGDKVLQSDGTWVDQTGGGGGAPVDAQYVVLSADATLTVERVLTAGIGLAFVDGGAGSTLTINIDALGVDTAQLANGAATNPKLADMTQSTIKGRASAAGTGDPQDLTAAQVRTIINVEDGATGDQTGAEIKSLYEAEANTNAYTDAEKSKLTGIEAGATADQAASEVPFTPVGTVAATDVQAAIAEVDSEKSATGHVHPVFSEDVNGFAPGPDAAEIAAATYLRADGTWVNPPGGSGGAPVDAQYVVLSANGTLTVERVLTAGTGIGITDAGAGSTVTIGIAALGVGTDEIAANAVTNAKLNDMSQWRIKGRVNAGIGNPQDLTAAQVLSIINVEAGANDYTHPNHSGEVTSVADGATTIADGAVVNARLADMAQSLFKGRASGAGSGAPQDLTATQARTILNVADGANAYVHPNHSGDVVSIADGATTIQAGVVSNSKLGDMAQALLKGRASGGGTGAPQDLSAAQVRTIINVEDGSTGDQTGAEIKSLYEAEADTNAYTDSEKSKLAGIEAGANYFTYFHPNHSGDVTSVGDGSQTIAANAVSNSKLADMAQDRMKGRVSVGAGDPEDLTVSQVRTLINVADGANAYVHPNHSGDVTSVADGAQTIVAEAVTNTKLAHMAQSTIKGRASGAGTGDATDLTATQVRTIINVEDGASADQVAGDVPFTPAGDLGSTDVQAALEELDSEKSAAGHVHATFIQDVDGFVPGPSAAEITAAKYMKADGTWDNPPGGAGGAPVDAQYVVLSANGTLTVERVLTAGTGLALVDGGAGSTVTLNIDALGVDTAQLANGAATNAKLADMAQSTIKGRASGAGTGDPVDLTATQVRTIINVADGANAYSHPNHSGDVTSVADGATTIVNGAVSNAKMVDMAQSTIKGRASGAGTGDPTDLTATQVRTLINVENGAAADQTAAEVSFTPAGSVAATDVQAAIEEVATEAAPIGLSFLTAETEATLTGSRKLNIQAPLVKVDAGAGGTFWLGLDITTAAEQTSPSSADFVIIEEAVGGANKRCQLGNLPGGGGGGAPTDSQYVVLALDGDLSAERVLVGGTGLTLSDSGADGNATLALTDMAQSTIKGRAAAAGTGAPTDLTAAQVRTIINVADGANAYTHPNHSGDVTSVADGATTIAAEAVTNTKLAHVATKTVKGRTAASTGDPTDLTMAELREMLFETWDTLTYSASITPNANSNSRFELTLTGNTTINVPTNLVEGQVITYRIRQNGTGGYGVTWHANYRTGSIPDVEVATDAAKTTYVVCVYHEDDTKMDMVSFMKDY